MRWIPDRYSPALIARAATPDSWLVVAVGGDRRSLVLHKWSEPRSARHKQKKTWRGETDGCDCDQAVGGLSLSPPAGSVAC